MSFIRPAIAASLLALAQLIGVASAASPEPLRLSVSRTPLSLPIFVAESQGYFIAEGLALTVGEVVGGHRSLQQVLDGAADLATCSEAVVMFKSFQHRDYAVVATFVTSDDDVKLVLRGDAGILRPQQLAGKTVGTVTGASSHYYLDTLLLLNGVDPKAVTVRHVQPEAMAEALRKGEVDAVAIWEPFAFQAAHAVPGARVLPKSGSYVETFNLVAAAKLKGARDDDLVRLLRALDRATQFIDAEPAQAQAILRDRLHVEQAVVDWIWPRFSYRLTLGQALLATLEGEARWARREGYVKAEKSPNYLDFIYAAPLRQVRPSAVGMD